MLTHSRGQIIWQAHCVEASSARMYGKLEPPRDDISTGRGNHQSVTLDWDPRKVCLFPSWEVRSTFQLPNNMFLLWGVIILEYSVCFYVIRWFTVICFYCKASFCYFYFSFWIPCSQNAATPPIDSTTMDFYCDCWTSVQSGEFRKILKDWHQILMFREDVWGRFNIDPVMQSTLAMLFMFFSPLWISTLKFSCCTTWDLSLLEPSFCLACIFFYFS